MAARGRLATVALLLAGLAVGLAACGQGRASLAELDANSATVPLEPGASDGVDASSQDWRLSAGGVLVCGLAADGRYLALAAPNPAQPADAEWTWPAGSTWPAAAPFAVQSMPLTAVGLSPYGLLLATNRRGLQFLEWSGGRSADRSLRLETLTGSREVFAHYTVAPGWLAPTGDGAAASPGATSSGVTSSGAPTSGLFLLYRHALFENDALSGSACRALEGALVLPAGSLGDPALPGAQNSLIVQASPTRFSLWPAFGSLRRAGPSGAGSLAAIYPQEAGRWYLQYRLDDAPNQSVSLRYGHWSGGESSFQYLDRAEFEAALTPLPLSAAAPSLRQAVAALGGDLIIETNLPDGRRVSYRQGDPAFAVTAAAMLGLDGAVTIVVPDGRAATVANGRLQRLELPRPVAETRFGAVVGLSGAVLVLWEEDLFPLVGRSGFLVLCLP